MALPGTLPGSGAQHPGGGSTSLPNKWRPGEAAVTGYVGAAFYEVSTDGPNALADEDATFPTIGGGGQYKLAGDQIDFGIEGLLGFSWNGDTVGFVSSGGGAAVAVDVHMLVFELFGGPFASCMLGDRTRIYGGAGPLLRWALYDQDGPTIGTSGDGDGFGAGYYVRAGMEFVINPRTMCGFGARWSDATMDLDGGFGDLDVTGIDYVITITQSF